MLWGDTTGVNQPTNLYTYGCRSESVAERRTTGSYCSSRSMKSRNSRYLSGVWPGSSRRRPCGPITHTHTHTQQEEEGEIRGGSHTHTHTHTHNRTEGG